MALFNERLSIEFDRLIYDFITSDTAYEYECDPNERKTRLAAFLESNNYIGRNHTYYQTSRTYPIMKYAQFPQILDIGKLSLKELYDALGFPLMWSTEQEHNVAQLMENLTESQLNKVLDLCRSLEATFWTHPEVTSLLPSKRIQAYIKNRYPTSVMRKLCKQLSPEVSQYFYKGFFRDLSGGTRVATEHFPEVLRIFDVPIKWAFILPETTPAMSKNLPLDNAMEAFCHLGKQNRDRVESFVISLLNPEQWQGVNNHGSY